MDFTLSKYRELLETLKLSGYKALAFEDYIRGVSEERFVILRHDVDKLPANSLKTAQIESECGMRSSYYFRNVPCSWEEGIIKEIASLGHEIGYHYENMDKCGGDADRAHADFVSSLEKLRKLVPVSTICMHGSPRSKFDNRDLWNKYSYKELGIIGEPYIDTDFSALFYLTDTGRRWDGFKVSLRDKIPGRQQEWIQKGCVYHSTDQIIRAVKQGKFPSSVMITTHPQRWNSSVFRWGVELCSQKVKNIVKYFILKSTKP